MYIEEDKQLHNKQKAIMKTKVTRIEGAGNEALILVLTAIINYMYILF
jgi:hypothetical protein